MRRRIFCLRSSALRRRARRDAGVGRRRHTDASSPRQRSTGVPLRSGKADLLMLEDFYDRILPIVRVSQFAPDLDISAPTSGTAATVTRRSPGTCTVPLTWRHVSNAG